MFVDLDWPLNVSSLLSASAELLVTSETCILFTFTQVIFLEKYFYLHRSEFLNSYFYFTQVKMWLALQNNSNIQHLWWWGWWCTAARTRQQCPDFHSALEKLSVCQSCIDWCCSWRWLLHCCVKLFAGFVSLGLTASQPDLGTAPWAPYIPESTRLHCCKLHTNIRLVEICLRNDTNWHSWSFKLVIFLPNLFWLLFSFSYDILLCYS